MPFLDNKTLRFFNSNGEDANFVVEDGVYKGTFYLPLTSTYLISPINIFMFEEFILDGSGDRAFGQPQDIAGPVEETIFRIEYQDKEDRRWTFYTYEEQNQLKVLQENANQFESTDPDRRTTGISGNFATTASVDGTGIRIAGNFSSAIEGSFRNNIQIYAIDPNNATEEMIVDIELYIEVEEEDQRLGTLINNFYQDVSVDQQDFFIFRDSDIKEGYPDWTIVNAKFKELLLNGRNLKNYQGSYRGLITAIRYFGYDSLRIKEFFENVDDQSKDFGKRKMKEIRDQFDGVIDPFYVDSEPLPNKIWKKNNQFGLFYDINKVVEGEFDEFGLPLVEDAFDFTNDEILIKLQGLKNKLMSKFLPLSARIVSITGEGTYFTKYDINSWSDYHVSDKINVGRDATFESVPGDCGFIINLNNLLVQIDSIVRQDRELVVPFNETIFYGTALNNVIPLANTAVEVFNMTVNGNDFFVQGVDYILAGNRMEILWISPVFVLSDNDELFIEYSYSALNTPLEDWNPEGAGAVDYTLLKNLIVDQTVALDSKYTQTFVEFIINGDDDPGNYPDDEDTPVGCPLTLRNTTFGLIWDDMRAQWDEADEGVSGSLTTWDRIKYENFYEIEWIISKQVTDESPQSYEFQQRGDVLELEELNLILPYSGDYDIRMRLYNTFNSSTSDSKTINVEQKNADVVANHKAFRTDFTWDQRIESWNNTRFTWAVNLVGDLLWEDAVMTWYSSDKAQYSNARNFNSLFNFTLEKFGNARWDQLDHLWWDGTQDATLYNPYTWETWGNRHWDIFYKNETWDGVEIASDSPAFLEIFSLDVDAQMTLGQRVPATYEVTTNDPILGPQTQILPLKHFYTRFASLDDSLPEGNLLQVTDSTGAVLLTITRDANNLIQEVDGIPIERANVIELTVSYAGTNVIAGQPAVDEMIILTIDGVEQVEGVDYTVFDPNTIVFTVPPTIGSEIFISYYSEELLVEVNQDTTGFLNLGGNTLEISDTAFYNNLNVGFGINLEIQTQDGLITLFRNVVQKLTGPDRIVYSGSNRAGITRLINPEIIEEIIINTDAPIKPASWDIVTQRVSALNANLIGDETERDIFAVDGDTILFSPGATDLTVAWQELVNSSLPNFQRFNWNILYKEDEVTVDRIQGVSKIFGKSQESWAEYSNMIGDIHAPALTLNYDWNELRIFSRRTTIPQFSQIIFTYDNAPTPGKQELAQWELTENESGTVYALTERVFSHFFDRRGEYILKLIVSDSNGNEKECLKQGLVIVE